MIDCGSIKVKISEEAPVHARLLITQDQPAGHLPKKLVELVINKDALLAELKGAKVL